LERLLVGGQFDDVNLPVDDDVQNGVGRIDQTANRKEAVACVIAEQHFRLDLWIGGDAAPFQRRDRLRENERRHFIGGDFQVIDGLLIERERFDGLSFGKTETKDGED